MARDKKKTQAKSTDSKVRGVKDENGWTHIVRGPKTCVDERQTDTFEPAAPIEGYDMALLNARFDKFSSTYRNNEAFAELESFFKDTLMSQPSFVIDNAICIGLGSFSSAESNWSASILRSMTQFVVFCEWVGHLKQKFPSIKVFFQDPRFNELDVEFINSKGFEVIKDPRAVELISTESFLFAPMAPWDLIFQLLAKAQPALYIGNDLDEAQTQIDLRYRHVEDFKGFPLETYLARGRREMPQSEQYSWMNHGAINYACHALPIIV